MHKWVMATGLATGVWLLAACTATIQPANVTSVTVEDRDGAVVAVVQGEFSDGCQQVGGNVQTVREDTVVVGLLLQPTPSDMMCTQVITPFTEEVPLDVAGLAAGSYTVSVNGASAEFTLGATAAETAGEEPATEEDATEESTSEESADTRAPVASVTVEQREGQTVIVVSGELPNPCYEAQAGSAQVNGATITADVTVTPPAPDMMCAAVITPYTVEIPVETDLAPGDYQVTVNDTVVDVTVQ